MREYEPNIGTERGINESNRATVSTGDQQVLTVVLMPALGHRPVAEYGIQQ
jgi:hypothetical protein